MARKLTVKQQIEALKIIVESEKGADSISREYVVEKAVKIKNSLTSSIFGQ